MVAPGPSETALLHLVNVAVTVFGTMLAVACLPACVGFTQWHPVLCKFLVFQVAYRVAPVRLNGCAMIRAAAIGRA